MQPALLHSRGTGRRQGPGHCPPRDGLCAGRCLQMRVPAAEGWRAALALPPARAAGRGAGGPAGQPAGAQAAGLCEEPAGCRPLAVSGGSTEKPKNRAAGRAGCTHLGRRGTVWTLNLSSAARQVRVAAPGRGAKCACLSYSERWHPVGTTERFCTNQMGGYYGRYSLYCCHTHRQPG